MEKIGNYKDFLRGLALVFGRSRPAKAPAGLADRVMTSLETGSDPRQQWDWDLPPALALSGVMAVFCIALWSGSDARRTEDEGARIVAFSADKTVIRPDEVVTLSWKVANTKKVYIRDPHGVLVEMGKAKSMSVHLNRPGQYKFTLIALGKDGKTVTKPLQATP